jgi:hypothetical protein
MSVFDDVREVAQKRIRDQLITEASTSNNLLRTLGMEIAKQCGCVTNFGPIKSEERANEKVYAPTAKGGYAGDWYDLKDLVRMTVIAPTLGQVEQVGAVIRQRCVARNKMGIMKDVKTFANTDPCGYSGLNFVIRLLNGRPGEIQVNIPEMIYAKEAEDLSKKLLGDAKFNQIKSRLVIEGGWGHKLYEIYRVAPATEKAKYAALVSANYYGYCRAGWFNRHVIEELKGQYKTLYSMGPAPLRPRSAAISGPPPITRPRR